MSAWFSRLDLDGVSEAQRRVVAGVVDLLDVLQPERLDRSWSVVERERAETWVRLRHDTEPWVRIEIVLTDGWVNFYGVMGHDEAYSPRPQPADGWEQETIEILAALLQSTFTSQSLVLRDKPWRDVVTIGAPYERSSTELRSLTSLLPRRRGVSRAAVRTASFGCRGSHGPTT